MVEARYPLTPRRRPDGRMEWVSPDPPACPNGDRWDRPGTFRRAYRPCGEHRGHSEWRCDIDGCDGRVWDPPLDETCGRSYSGPKF